MEAILLKIDKTSASAWNNSAPSLRAAYQDKIVAVLKEFQEAEQVDEDGFTKAQRDFLAKEAAENENNEPYEWWNDEEMIADLDRRSADLRSGKNSGISLEESKSQLMSRFENI